jgi:uncharacterized phage infection (PIP) family protein YhgE
METIESIAQELENLKKKLDEEIEKFQEDVTRRKEEILNLEKALSEVVETKQLRVADNAQIAGRDIVADGQTLDNHENSLNNQNLTLNTHTTTLSSHEQMLSNHEQTLSQLQTQITTALSSISEINNRDIFRYTVIPICHYDSPDSKAQWDHPCGDLNLINNHNYSVQDPYFFGLQKQ